MSLFSRDFTGNGDFIRLSFPFGSVKPSTVVTASITEIDGDGLPFVGAATVEITILHHEMAQSTWSPLCAGTTLFDAEFILRYLTKSCESVAGKILAGRDDDPVLDRGTSAQSH